LRHLEGLEELEEGRLEDGAAGVGVNCKGGGEGVTVNAVFIPLSGGSS